MEDTESGDGIFDCIEHVLFKWLRIALDNVYGPFALTERGDNQGTGGVDVRSDKSSKKTWEFFSSSIHRNLRSCAADIIST